MNTWKPLEHEVHRRLRELPLRGRALILALSGGADSTALFHILKVLSGPLGFALSCCYCHHGSGKNTEFRDASEVFAQMLCSREQVPFQVVRNLDLSLNSEEELRNFRHQNLEKIRQSEGEDALLVFAHHQDDLLETRLLRLMRGTGLQGLEAMSPYRHPVLRPLLGVSRLEIEDYLRTYSQDFMKDPTREDLRSFIREQWLPLLENRQKGAVQAMARSLEVIVASGENLDLSKYLGSEGIRGPEFLCLSVEQQTRLLANYILSLGVRNYSRGILQEIIKNLDKTQTVHTFTIAGLRWDIDAKNIRATVL